MSSEPVLRVQVNPEAFAVDADRLEQAVRHVLAREGVGEGEVSLTLLADPAMQDLNRRWLAHDRTTDVLSFALQGDGEPLLGDVYVGWEQAERQSAEHGVPLAEELVRLAVHGTLHLLGHDHPDAADERPGSPFFQRQETLVTECLEKGADHGRA